MYKSAIYVFTLGICVGRKVEINQICAWGLPIGKSSKKAKFRVGGFGKFLLRHRTSRYTAFIDARGS